MVMDEVEIERVLFAHMMKRRTWDSASDLTEDTDEEGDHRGANGKANGRPNGTPVGNGSANRRSLAEPIERSRSRGSRGSRVSSPR